MGAVCKPGWTLSPPLQSVCHPEDRADFVSRKRANRHVGGATGGQGRGPWQSPAGKLCPSLLFCRWRLPLLSHRPAPCSLIRGQMQVLPAPITEVESLSGLAHPGRDCGAPSLGMESASAAQPPLGLDMTTDCVWPCAVCAEEAPRREEGGGTGWTEPGLPSEHTGLLCGLCVRYPSLWDTVPQGLGPQCPGPCDRACPRACRCHICLLGKRVPL